MSLTIEQKKAVVSEVNGVAQGTLSAIAADYSGMTVANMEEFRNKAREAGVLVRVVRNTLARRAFKDTSLECMEDGLKGHLVLAFSLEEPSAAAKICNDFAKNHAQFQVKLVAYAGQLLEPAELARLAAMPTRVEAISQLMSVMLAPISKLARTLAEPTAKLARTLAAVRDQKQAA